MAQLTRRAALAGLIAAPALHLAEARAEPTRNLQNVIDAATRAGRAARLPKGATTTRPLILPPGAHLVGASGGSTLRLSGAGPLIRGERAARTRLEGVRFEGKSGDAKQALVSFSNISNLDILGCSFFDAAGDGLRIDSCGGRIAENIFERIGATALFSTDASGLVVENNRIAGCGDNGIRIWRWRSGYDGSRVSDNRIRKIDTRSGGTGENGNGVSLWLADGVTATRNDVRDVAWAALRNASCRNITFADNVCADVKETAIWAEFAFRDATITGNRIDGAGAGISMTNLAEHNGRGAICTGNIVRNIRPIVTPQGKVLPNQRAIHAEADARIAGNEVDGSPWVGINLGWGPYLQNVSVEDNTIRNAPYAIGFSVAPGAGRGRIVGNRIANAGKAAVVALRWEDVASGDLLDGCGKWPNVECALNRRI